MIRSWTKDGDWLMELLNQTGLDRKSIQEEIDFLLWEYEFENPESPSHEIRDNVCHKLVVWSSSKVATSAGVTTAPVSLPVIGAIGSASLGATVDLIFLIRTQIELCYAIAAVYHIKMSDLQLKAVILALLGYVDNDDIAKDITKTSLNQLINSMATHFITRGLRESSIEVVERLATRLFGRMVRWIPLISIPINVSMNVNAIKSIGARAQQYFEENI
ncbi:magnetosomen protein-like [Candidatus Magnetomorum sp. HK-1]|nr:magnetosomen protein-like [Candidatus Magnetomorum sp. HK-1]